MVERENGERRMVERENGRTEEIKLKRGFPTFNHLISSFLIPHSLFLIPYTLYLIPYTLFLPRSFQTVLGKIALS